MQGRGTNGLPSNPRAAIMGTGLMGGSIGLALRHQGWSVAGWDADPERRELAVELGVVDELDEFPEADLTFVAVPVRSVSEVAEAALARGGVVTDIGSVKAPVVQAIDHPMFIGGHPMAGSEALGVRGSVSELFEGAVWVLTPSPATDPQAQALVHSVVRSFGAEVLTLDAQQHDLLVATVSHVPHLTAAMLMGLASARSVDNSALLRLAAGGFRDMTRIASGDPRMWIDICADNKDAILGALDEFAERVADMRSVVATGDSEALVERLTAAQNARRSLPIGVPEVEQLAEVAVPIPDRPGELAAVTALATSLLVNVYDIEVVHSAGEAGGRLLLIVDANKAAEFADALQRSGRNVTVNEL